MTKHEAMETPIRYDSGTNSYSGGSLLCGDTITDGTDVFRVTRRSGYFLCLDVLTPGGWKVSHSRCVDHTSPEYRGDLWRCACPEGGAL